MFKYPLFVFLAALFISGCSHNNPLLMNSEEQSVAKSFSAPKDGSGYLYVYRNECRGIGSALVTHVYIDGKLAGPVEYRSFQITKLNAGPHKIMIQAGAAHVTHLVDIEPNKNTYLNYFRLKIKTIDEKQAQQDILPLPGLKTGI